MPNQTPASALNALLADSFALYLKTKNFHWHVGGSNFRELHLLFDEQAAQIFAMTDLIAERVRKLGGKTHTSIGSIARAQRIKDDDSESLVAKAMLVALRDDNRLLVESLKTLKLIVDEAGDNATSGLLDGWTDEAEQRAWFLNATLAE